MIDILYVKHKTLSGSGESLEGRGSMFVMFGYGSKKQFILINIKVIIVHNCSLVKLGSSLHNIEDIGLFYLRLFYQKNITIINN